MMTTKKKEAPLELGESSALPHRPRGDEDEEGGVGSLCRLACFV